MRFFTSNHKFFAKKFLLAIFLCLSFTLNLVSCNAYKNNPEALQSLSPFELTSLDDAQAIDVSAKSAIAIEVSSGEIYFEKNAHERLPMASTTKIMTALVAIESGNLEREVCVSPEAVGVEGSSVYLYPGERISLYDLLCALLLESANDAAAAIAIDIGGSILGFADMMNEKAEALGLSDTSFQNPHGLDAENHFTTAHDLAKISLAAMQNPTFREIVSTYKKVGPPNENGFSRLFVNHNKMLKNYDGAIGVKTGFTKKSGRCLVSAARRDGVELIAVTLDAPNDWQDHENMLNLGFSLYSSKEIYAVGEYKAMQSVISGADSSVVISNSEPLTAVTRGSGEICEHIELSRFSYAPIKKNQILGYIYYTQNGKIIAKSPLVADHSVDAKKYKSGLFG